MPAVELKKAHRLEVTGWHKGSTKAKRSYITGFLIIKNQPPHAIMLDLDNDSTLTLLLASDYFKRKVWA